MFKNQLSWFVVFATFCDVNDQFQATSVMSLNWKELGKGVPSVFSSQYKSDYLIIVVILLGCSEDLLGEKVQVIFLHLSIQFSALSKGP